MESLGANKLGEPAWGDERAPNGYVEIVIGHWRFTDYSSIEETLLPWLRQTLDLFLPYLPTSLKNKEIASTSLSPPIYKLEKTGEDLVKLAELDLDSQVNGHRNAEAGPSRIRKAEPTWKRDDWVWATLKKNRRVTKEDWWQDVREIEFEFEDPDL